MPVTLNIAEGRPVAVVTGDWPHNRKGLCVQPYPPGTSGVGTVMLHVSGPRGGSGRGQICLPVVQIRQLAATLANGGSLRLDDPSTQPSLAATLHVLGGGGSAAIDITGLGRNMRSRPPVFLDPSSVASLVQILERAAEVAEGQRTPHQLLI